MKVQKKQQKRAKNGELYTICQLKKKIKISPFSMPFRGYGAKTLPQTLSEPEFLIWP